MVATTYRTPPGIRCCPTTFVNECEVPSAIRYEVSRCPVSARPPRWKSSENGLLTAFHDKPG